MRSMMHLPRAEGGLVRLRSLFRERLAPGEFDDLPEKERRERESDALGALLRADLDIDQRTATKIMNEILAELGELFASPTVPRTSSGSAAKDEDATGLQLRGPGGLQSDIARRGSGNGTALAELTRAVSEYHLAQAQQHRLLALKQMLGNAEGDQDHHRGADEREPIHLSDLGHVVLFCSPTFVRHLAQRGEQRAAQRASRQEARDSTGVGEPGRASRGARSSFSVSPMGSPQAGTRRSRLFSSGIELPQSPWKSRVGSRLGSTVLSVDGEGDSNRSEEAASVDTAAVVICEMFSLFDCRHVGAVFPRDLRDIGRKQAMVRDELEPLVAFLSTTARSLSSASETSAVAAGAAQGARDGARANVQLRRGPFEHLGEEGAPGAEADEEPEAAGARTGGGDGMPDWQLVRQASSGLARVHASTRKPKQVERISETQFFVGMSAWILLAEEDHDDDAPDDAAALAKGAPLGKAVPTLALGGKGKEARPAPLLTKEAVDPKAVVDPREELESIVGSAAAHVALARALSQRMSSERLHAGNPIDWDIARAVAAQIFTLPQSVTADHLRDWAVDTFDLHLEEEVVDTGPFATVDDETKVATWETFVNELDDAAVAMRAGGARSAAKRKAGAQSAPGHQRSAKPFFIIRVSSPLFRLVHCLFVICAIVDFIVIPIELTFIVLQIHIDPVFFLWAHERLSNLSIAVSSWCLLRLCLRFVTSYVNDELVEITSPSAIRQAYLRGDFVKDFIGAWPEDLVAKASGASPLTYTALRMLRFVNLRYMRGAVHGFRACVGKSSVVGNIFLRLLPMMAVTHILTCVWQAILDLERTRTMVITWDDPLDQSKPLFEADWKYHSGSAQHVLDEYLNAFLRWLTMSIFNLPANRGELAFVMCMFSVHLVLYAWTVGGVSGIVMRHDDDIVAKRAQLELVNAYIRRLNVPIELKERMRAYFIARIQSASSISAISGDDIYSQLPVSLQMDVAAATSRPLVGAAPLFFDCSPGFLDRLAAMLGERSIEAETSIFRAGEACGELIIVASGTIEVYADAEDDNAVEMCTRGTIVGTVPFAFGIRHIQNARVSKDAGATVFYLTTGAYKELLKAFPRQEDFIMENAMRAFDESLGGQSARSGRSKASSLGTSAISSAISSAAASEGGMSHASQGTLADAEVNVNNVIALARSKRQKAHHVRLCWACSKGDVDKVKRLLTATCIDLDATDDLGRTALHLGACGGSAKVTKLLISARANVNAEDKRGRAPLTDALLEGHEEVVTVLKQAGAKQGRSLAQFCNCHPHDHLCKAVADGDERELKKLVEQENPVDSADPHGRVALHVAAAEGQLSMLQYLIDKKADVNVEDEDGLTPLWLAVSCGHELCGDALVQHGARFGRTFDEAEHLCMAASTEDTSQLARLVKYKCDVNARDSLGRTALHVAACSLQEPAVVFLLRVPGINVNAENAFGNTPLDDALRLEDANHPVISTLLRSRGGAPGRQAVVADRGMTASIASHQAVNREHEALEHLKSTAKARKALIARAKAIDSWAAVEMQAAARMKEAVDAAIALQRAQGAVLADQMPEFWEHIRTYSEEHSAWHTEAVRIVIPALTAWVKEADPKAKPAMEKALEQVEAMVKSHEEYGVHLDHLSGTTFRKPARPAGDAMTRRGSTASMGSNHDGETGLAGATASLEAATVQAGAAGGKDGAPAVGTAGLQQPGQGQRRLSHVERPPIARNVA